MSKKKKEKYLKKEKNKQTLKKNLFGIFYFNNQEKNRLLKNTEVKKKRKE